MTGPRHPYDHWNDPRQRHAHREEWRRRARQMRRMHKLEKMRRWAEMEAGGIPFPRERGWRWHMRARNRWHQRWHRHHAQFKHSLGARLIAIFVVLACAGIGILWASMQVEYGLLWAVPLLLLVTGLAYGGIRHLVGPLRELAAGAEAFGRGDLEHRVPIYHRDEIGDLAHRFNQMAEDIQAMLDGKRALLLAISHELRSPLTRARLHAELVDEGASKEALLDELAQMRELISALLESERLGSGHRALHVADCDLGALAREQDQPGVALRIERDLPVLKLDRMRVQLLLRNLVHNALRHNDPEAGPVMVSVERDGQGVRLTVRDHGSGVSPDVLSQLGQPFFRPDEARARSEGGVGLGLSLCRLVAEAHGSRLELRNAQPGFEAAVRFP
ncbi:HAMP domain-containing sensor histidine kinase [Roseateles chitinivorans]|uniref:HAMP domain-containing sensor histidine kinase n=1 Tax=Roseateles chitinivorans TaxID=2917965 RepID=UPI003D667A2E